MASHRQIVAQTIGTAVGRDSQLRTGDRPNGQTEGLAPAISRRLLRSLGCACKTLRRDGFLVLLWRTVVRCFAPFGSLALLDVCERDLNQAVPEVQGPSEIAVTMATPADLEQIGAQIAADFHGGADALPAVRSKIRSRQQLGQTCFVAKIGPTVVHYQWIAFRSSPVEDRCIRLTSQEAYLAWAFTCKSWRGHHIFPTADSFVLRLLQESGYKRIFTFVKFDNTSSRTALERVGWRQIGRLLTLKRPRGRTRILCLRGNDQRRFIEQPPSPAVAAGQLQTGR